MAKLEIDNNQYDLFEKAVELFGDVFAHDNQELARLLKTHDEEGIREFVKNVAERSIDKKVVEGVCAIVILASTERATPSSRPESDEFMLGRLLEFCHRCAEGAANEMGRFSTKKLPVWLKRI